MKEAVIYRATDDGEFLVVKGDFTKEQMLKSARAQGVIDDGDFDGAHFYQSHFKTIPAPKFSGLNSWDCPIERPCKGSFFASVLQKS
ncbi:hypothetical protein [Pseudoalteromonas ruthenica]|uniref:hypothetical protein n=1 Tax=Pseudoalteromonas ruthenica TaxID=151081 RepID=UPI00110B4DB5|nr:hypothetical protein [Pseudoalteromonas ruthenica]TMP23761.1 hypothetical protein CWC06_09410 [Pseudoalteromonas ruthenica]